MWVLEVNSSPMGVTSSEYLLPSVKFDMGICPIVRLTVLLFFIKR